METRIALLGVAGTLALLAGGAGAWFVAHRAVEPPAAAARAIPEPPLPVPPVPPRIAEGEDYENCLAMLPNDPSGASETAEAWQARGGGDAATHCLALSKVELGDAAGGAQMLEDLATASHAPASARAEVFDQADQAWLIAGEAAHAFGAATLALALSPEDVDLLVNRAVAAGNLDRFSDALADLSKALEQDQGRVDALVLRGSAQRHLGHLDLAQADIDRALALDPDNAEGLLERGILRERGNDQVGARKDWERAISIDPDSSTADLGAAEFGAARCGAGAAVRQTQPSGSKAPACG